MQPVVPELSSANLNGEVASKNKDRKISTERQILAVITAVFIAIVTAPAIVLNVILAIKVYAYIMNPECKNTSEKKKEVANKILVAEPTQKKAIDETKLVMKERIDGILKENEEIIGDIIAHSDQFVAKERDANGQNITYDHKKIYSYINGLSTHSAETVAKDQAGSADQLANYHKYLSDIQGIVGSPIAKGINISIQEAFITLEEAVSAIQQSIKSNELEIQDQEFHALPEAHKQFIKHLFDLRGFTNEVEITKGQKDLETALEKDPQQLEHFNKYVKKVDDLNKAIGGFIEFNRRGAPKGPMERIYITMKKGQETALAGKVINGLY